jgi:hypothetical protein
MEAINTPVGQAKKPKNRSKWHYGIRSKSPPLDIMLELYRALQNTGMQFKTIDAYHIRARYITPRKAEIVFEMQLFTVEANSYLVDFRNMTQPYEQHNTGEESSELVYLSTMGFHEVCCKLIRELAVSA